MIENIETGTTAVIDLCLQFLAVHNHDHSYSDCFEVEISFMSSDSLVLALPYQILALK